MLVYWSRHLMMWVLADLIQLKYHFNRVPDQWVSYFAAALKDVYESRHVRDLSKPCKRRRSARNKRSVVGDVPPKILNPKSRTRTDLHSWLMNRQLRYPHHFSDSLQAYYSLGGCTPRALPHDIRKYNLSRLTIVSYTRLPVLRNCTQTTFPDNLRLLSSFYLNLNKRIHHTWFRAPAKCFTETRE